MKFYFIWKFFTHLLIWFLKMGFRGYYFFFFVGYTCRLIHLFGFFSFKNALITQSVRGFAYALHQGRWRKKQEPIEQHTLTTWSVSGALSSLAFFSLSLSFFLLSSLFCQSINIECEVRIVNLTLVSTIVLKTPIDKRISESLDNQFILIYI